MTGNWPVIQPNRATVFCAFKRFVGVIELHENIRILLSDKEAVIKEYLLLDPVSVNTCQKC